MLRISIILSLVIMLFANWRPSNEPVSLKFSLTDEILYIKIFSQLKIQSFTFSSEAGNYSVWANGVEIINTSKFPIIKFSFSNDSIEVKTFENVIGKFKHLKISCNDDPR